MAYTTIDDPSAHFQIVTYTGDGNSTQAITNTGNSDLQPDLVWCKQSSHTTGHNLTDSTRGASKALFSEGTDTEDTGGNISSFNSDGFTTTDANRTNQSGRTFVAWQWKANGGTTTTNDASSTGVGDIDSVYQANTTAGFSIVTYTGAASGSSAFTIAHGLGAVPKWIVVKNRDSARAWEVFNGFERGNGARHYGMSLDATDAQNDSDTYWADTNPTSTVFSVRESDTVNENGDDFVAYCFSEIQGYSKFGGYIGNGNADGTFVYTGFKPAWLMIKRADSGESWHITDIKRDDHNPLNTRLHANTTGANDTSEDGWDFLSNGFKLRTTWGGANAGGGTYVYMAFAEYPFVSSKGVPATAR